MAVFSTAFLFNNRIGWLSGAILPHAELRGFVAIPRPSEPLRHQLTIAKLATGGNAAAESNHRPTTE